MIRENREQIITNDNTAQETFNNFIDTLAKPLKKIELVEPLYGDLDLSSLKEMGKGIPEEIIFTKGSITNIINIPDGVLYLNCAENMLLTLENVPTSILVLNIEENYIESISISTLVNLERLNVSHNNITELTALPKKLIELKCTHNKIENLNLLNNVNLKILHVSNNIITFIENFPENIVDFQMENTPNIEFRNNIQNIPDGSQNKEETSKKTKEYNSALFEYFKLKKVYDNKIHMLKKKAYEKAPTKRMAKQAILAVKGACIKCKRNVGTIFETKQTNYTALCGDDTAPCNLNINIYTGSYMHYEEGIRVFKDSVYDQKVNIIRGKMDNIFGYIDDETAKKRFDKNLEEYNLDSGIYKEILDKHDEIFNNVEKEENIHEKRRQIFNIIDTNKQLIGKYKNENNQEIVKDMVRNNIDDLYRYTRSLRNLKHEIMEVNYDDNNLLYKLYQYPVLYDKFEINMQEPVKVVKFDR
jgi:hypothetical protein